MKIQGTQRPYVVDAPRTSARGQAEPTADRNEQIDVSSAARSLRVARDAPEVPDTAKVARIRSSIANGDFKIDYDAIADRMLQEET